MADESLSTDPGDVPPDEAVSEHLAELAFGQATTALKDQAEALEKLRVRSTGFTSALVAVVALLAGFRRIPIGTEDRWMLGAAGVLGLLSLGASFVVLAPRHLTFYLHADFMIADPEWREEVDPKGKLAFYLSREVRTNEARLRTKAWLFSAQMLLGGLAVAALMLYVFLATEG
jgi:hypothetical protein